MVVIVDFVYHNLPSDFPLHEILTREGWASLPLLRVARVCSVSLEDDRQSAKMVNLKPLRGFIWGSLWA